MLLVPAPFITSVVYGLEFVMWAGRRQSSSVKFWGSFLGLSGICASCNWSVSYLPLPNSSQNPPFVTEPPASMQTAGWGV